MLRKPNLVEIVLESNGEDILWENLTYCCSYLPIRSDIPCKKS